MIKDTSNSKGDTMVVSEAECLLRQKDVAKRWNVSRAFVSSLRDLPRIEIGGRIVRYRKSDIIEFETNSLLKRESQNPFEIPANFNSRHRITPAKKKPPRK